MSRLWVKLGLGVLAIVACGLAIVLIESQTGWRALPDEPPQTMVVLDTRYDDAGRNALDRLEAMRARYGVPGATAAVSVDGVLVWSAGTGWADLETLSPATPQTLFRIGSTSKAMTATVLARLTDSGALTLTDTVADHIPTPANPEWSPLTLAQLMSHTAGLPGYENNTDYIGLIGTQRMQKQYQSVEESLALFDGSDLRYEPGERFEYSSFDINLAAVMAEYASGASYGDLIETQIRDPLGLESPILANHGPRPDSVAQFYRIRETDSAKIWASTNVSQRWPSGGLYSRSKDLVQVAGAWLDENYLAATTRDQFWTPMRLSSGEINEQSYAIGWRSSPESTSRFGENAPVHIVHHGGVSRGAMSWLVLYPELGISVAVNINTRTPEFSDFSSVEPEILRLFAHAAGRTPDGAAPQP